MMKLTDEDFFRLVNYMKENYGINLEKKRVLIEGRLVNTVTARGFSSFKDFIDFALADPSGRETMQLVNKLTTNHTFFLREPEHFRYLSEVILPYLEKNVLDHDLRIWCAASSTGQEPYSLVMTMCDYFGDRAKDWNMKILATDLDTDVLKAAKSGVYSEDLVKDVPASWLNKYFIKIGDSYHVSDVIRRQVEFRQFNLMNPIVCHKPYDLISCRNVMIYFEQDTKNDLVERFYNVTKDGGYLFVGHAENVSKSTRYTYVKPAIYRRIRKDG